MKKILSKLSFISLVSLIVLTLFPTKINAQEIVQQQLGGRGYKEVEDLGAAAYSVAITSAVFEEKNGVTYGYTVANGGILNVINAETNELVYNKKIDNLNTVWSHAMTTDGILYIAGLDFENKGVLYAYNSDTHEIVNYGNINSNHQFWSTALDENNNLYIGTYLPGSNGSVFKFDHTTKKWTDLGVILPNNDADYVRSMAYHEGSLYLGIGLQGRMIKLELATGKKTDLSSGAYDIIGRPDSTTTEVQAAVQAVEGKQVLATIDNSTAENVAIATVKMPVGSMTTYKATSYANVTGRGGSMYLRFYDADGKYITDHAHHVENSKGGWNLITIENTVPTNAVTFQVVFGSSAYWTNSGAYFDDLKVLDTTSNQYISIQNAGFEEGLGKDMPGYVPISTTTVAVDYNIQNNVSVQTISSDPAMKFLYDMAIIDDLLIARFDADYRNILMFFDLETQTWHNVKYEKEAGNTDLNNQGAFGWNTLKEINGKTYISFNYALNELDLETLELKPVLKADGTEVSFKTGFRGFGVIDNTKFVTAVRAGYIQVFDTKTNTLESKETVMQATPITLHNLAKDNNGDLYVTTYPGGPRGAKYDVSEGKFVSYAQGQAEGIVAGEGNDIYFGFYPGASFQVMDTETLKTETLFNLKDVYGQDRPYIMEFIEGKLYSGTIPDYGKLGSTLSIYDPKTGDLKVYKDPIKDQSIVGIVKVGNMILGSTTIHGGLQTTPTADEAVVFLFDLEQEKVVKEATLNIPGLGKTPHISGLAVAEDGTVWGIADGIIFTINPETLEVIDYKDVYPDVRNYGRWRPMNIEFGEGGLLYANIGGKMTVIDPSTENWDHITIPTKPIQFFTLSKNAEGNEALYILEDSVTNVLRVDIVEGGILQRQPETENVYVEGENLSFENGLEGWSILGGTDTEKTSVSASKDMATDGTTSLKIVDSTDSNMIFLESPRLPVVAGEKYFVEVDLNIETGMTSMYLRFYDENGKQTHKDVDNTNIILTRGSDRGWVKVSANMVAPEGSVYAIVGLGTSNYATTPAAYYDNLVLYTQIVKPALDVAVEELVTVVEDIEAEVATLVASDYEATSWTRFINALNYAREIIKRFNQPVTRMMRVAIPQNPTLLDVELALQELKDAKAALVKVSDLPESGNTNNNTNDNTNNNTNDNTNSGAKPTVPGETTKPETLPSTGVASVSRFAFASVLMGIFFITRKKED